MAVRAGSLRHTVQIQSRTSEKDSFGGESDLWVNTTPDGWRCSIKPLSGRELDIAAQQNSRATHEIRIRWNDGLTSLHRFVEVESGRVFHLTEPPRNFQERNHEMLCICMEVT